MSNSHIAPTDAAEPDFDQLLHANLERVFNERDPARRAAAIDELYVEEPVMYEPTGIVAGRAAISDVAGRLLEQFGPSFAFTAEGQGVGHHGLGCLRWRAGLEGGPSAVTGTDAAEIVDGRIARLWVLLNPAAD